MKYEIITEDKKQFTADLTPVQARVISEGRSNPDFRYLIKADNGEEICVTAVDTIRKCPLLTEVDKMMDDLEKKADEIGAEILWKANIMENKLLHYWYGGDVAAVRYKGYLISISAIGDVIASLYEKTDAKGAELAYVKDKGNNGIFGCEMSPYLKNDDELMDAIRNYRIVIDNNNWYEVSCTDPKGVWHDLMYASDNDKINEVIEEVLEYADDIIRMAVGDK